MYAFEDEDNLINHFDLTPNGQEAWLADKNGGISHVDFRTNGERRRWVVQDIGRGAKLGGLSVNRKLASTHPDQTEHSHDAPPHCHCWQ